MKITNVVSALALTLIPFAALADDKPAMGGTDLGPPPGEVLTKLHHSNQMEIEAGKLALEKGHSKAVKDYGRTLVKDHTAADKKVTALAKQLKVEFETMPAMTNAKLESAKAATGPDFDKAFAEAMLEEHTRDVNEASAARDATNNPKLKKLLTALVPKLEMHRDTAQKLVDTTGSAAAGTASTTGAGAPGAAGTAATGARGTTGSGAATGTMPPTKPPRGETGASGGVK